MGAAAGGVTSQAIQTEGKGEELCEKCALSPFDHTHARAHATGFDGDTAPMGTKTLLGWSEQHTGRQADRPESKSDLGSWQHLGNRDGEHSKEHGGDSKSE